MRQTIANVFSAPWFGWHRHGGLACAALLVAAPLTLAQPGGHVPIDFVTISAPGNAPYTGNDPFGHVTGRGGVGYEYRMAQSEVTTAQWIDFINTFKARPDPVPDSVLPLPVVWGGVVDTSYTGPGVRYRPAEAPGSDMRPTFGITWRTAARYANWLHNDQSADLSAIANGAYDTSTFGDNPDGTFTDQLTHSPGARFWIPTLDETLKAFHFDPHRNGPNMGGWWTYSNGSDTPYQYGLPPSMGGTGEANAGFNLPNFAEFDIPLGLYNARTPWGLMDAAGGATEWTEEVFVQGAMGWFRRFDGSRAGLNAAAAGSRDSIWGVAAGRPRSNIEFSTIRVAGLVPAPGVSGMFLIVAGILVSRRTRSITYATDLSLVPSLRPPVRHPQDCRPASDG